MNATPKLDKPLEGGSSPVPCSASFVRLFQPRFAALVERGEKLQTVRPPPKRMPKPGDKISLRAWTGQPYRSKQRVLREATITSVQPISISNCGIMVDGGLRIHPLDDEFAVADGFSSFHEMADWFDITHGLPFVGVLICWQNDKVMAHPLAGANVDRGVRVEIRWKHRKQRG